MFQGWRRLVVRVQFTGIPEGVSPYATIPQYSYQFGVDESQGNTRIIAQLLLHSVHKVGGVVVASPILGMSVEGWVWTCWASGRKANDTQLFCQHWVTFVLPLYLDIGIEGAVVYNNQDLLKAIREMPEQGIISFDDYGCYMEAVDPGEGETHGQNNGARGLHGGVTDPGKGECLGQI